MIKFNQLRNAFMYATGRRHAVARTLVVVVALVLLAGYVAVRRFAAPTYAGPVTVTANMGQFTPNPVFVGDPATASLSAHYTPPSGVPEGQLSASYAWSIGAVQYKALQADTFGSPPANSYTDSISPAQPSANSGATLTFTPKIAGYWQVSTSCGVTVTDSQTNQYWSGSATAGPEDLTSYSLDITYTGTLIVNGQVTSDSGTVVTNRTEAVHAGWPIQLGAALSPSDLASQFTWTIQGAGGNGSEAIGGYSYSSEHALVTPLVPAIVLGQAFGPYFYTGSGNERASVKPVGANVPAVTTLFGIVIPAGNMEANYEADTVLHDLGGGSGGIAIGNPWSDPYVYGVVFQHPPIHSNQFQGKSYFVQVYTEDDYWTGAGSYKNYPATGSGLDEKVPYGYTYTLPDGEDAAADAPGRAATTNYSSVSVSDSPTMWLMYTPAAKGSVPVPLQNAPWVWGGTEKYNGTNWTISGQFPNYQVLPQPIKVQDSSFIYPTWKQVLQPPAPPP